MKETETDKNQFETLFERVEEYGNVNIKLLKYKMIDATAEVLSAFVSNLIIMTVFLLFTFLLSIGVALWLGDILGKTYYGFFIVTAVYGIAGLIIYLLRKQIQQNMGDSIISKAFKN